MQVLLDLLELAHQAGQAGKLLVDVESQVAGGRVIDIAHQVLYTNLHINSTEQKHRTEAQRNKHRTEAQNRSTEK